jgi:hypothetical protein
MRNVYKLSTAKPNRRDHLGGLGIDGEIILKWFLMNEDMRM